MNDKKEPPLDLSALDFGPAWAKKTTNSSTKKQSRKEGSSRPKRETSFRKKSRSHDRESQSYSDNRRRSGDGQKRRNPSRQIESVPPPEGLTAGVFPIEEGLDNLAKEIRAAGRTYTIFSLAKVILGARERFNIQFQSQKEHPLYRGEKDHSVWLTKKEAVNHYWKSSQWRDHYEEVIQEGESPKGSFQSIAKCGLSGKLLGPPNHHHYQIAIATLHAERFSHLSLENYKKNICLEHGEEAVNNWIEQAKRQIVYRPRVLLEEPSDRPTKPEDLSPDVDSEEKLEAISEPPISEETPSEAEAELSNTEENSSSDIQPEPELNDEPLLDRKAAEEHFLKTHFDEVFVLNERAFAPSNISATLLSPGLLTLLRQTIAEEKRYPAKLSPFLCRQFSGRNIAIFKWKKKLMAGPSRPHSIPDDIPIADRPTQLLDWIREHSGQKINLLWEAVLEKNISDDLKRSYYQDLHWILNQGYALLTNDGSLHIGKTPPPSTANSAATTSPKKEAVKPETKSPPENGEKNADKEA